MPTDPRLAMTDAVQAVVPGEGVYGILVSQLMHNMLEVRSARYKDELPVMNRMPVAVDSTLAAGLWFTVATRDEWLKLGYK